MVNVVVDKCYVNADGKFVVVLESTSHDALRSVEAKNRAIQHAQSQGYNRAGINGTTEVYAVDTGKHNNGPTTWRIDITILAGL